MPHPEETRGVAVDAQAAALLAVLGQGSAGNMGDLLAWGRYTPVPVLTTNIAAAVIGDPWTWVRIGNVVIIGGRVDVTFTAGAGTQSELQIPLPVGSIFENAGDGAGTWAPLTASTEVFGAVVQNVAPYRIRILGLAQAVAPVNLVGMMIYSLS